MTRFKSEPQHTQVKKSDEQTNKNNDFYTEHIPSVLMALYSNTENFIEYY